MHACMHAASLTLQLSSMSHSKSRNQIQFWIQVQAFADKIGPPAYYYYCVSEMTESLHSFLFVI